MIFHSQLGLIALDIDGTITSEVHYLHPAVIHYFDSLWKEGWQFIFITGRPFEWGYQTLQPLPFPYTFAVQNGALIVEIPSHRILDRRYLNDTVLSKMEAICQEEQTGFVVYGGFDYGDQCYYCPSQFSPELLNYLQERVAFLNEKWMPLSSFASLPISTFSSLKCFGGEREANRLSHKIEKRLHLHAPINRDPFNQNYFVIQATHTEATKGEALKHFLSLQNKKLPIIAAGDDYNDLSMLQKAHIKIVMANAPEDLLQLADVIAPSAEENGIIEGLSKAIKML